MFAAYDSPGFCARSPYLQSGLARAIIASPNHVKPRPGQIGQQGGSVSPYRPGAQSVAGLTDCPRYGLRRAGAAGWGGGGCVIIVAIAGIIVGAFASVAGWLKSGSG